MTNSPKKSRSTNSPPIAGPLDILAQIERGQFQPVYVLFGGDVALAEELIAALKRQLLVPGLEPFDLETVHGSDIGSEGRTVVELLQHSRQPPVGAQRRLMVIRGLEAVHREAAKELCAGLAQTPPSSVVVVTCAYEQRWRQLFKDSGIAQWVVSMWPPTGPLLVPAVMRWARSLGLVLARDAAQLLIELAGAETLVLKSELEKLATNCGGRPTRPVSVTSTMVQQLVARSRLFDLYDYVDRVLDQDRAGALLILRRLSGWGESPMGIVAVLTNGLLNLLRAKLGLSPLGHLRRSSGQRLEKWDLAALDRSLHRLYGIARAVVQGHPEPFVLLDLFTMEYLK